MIRINIDGESQLKEDFKNRFRTLVKTRVEFYIGFFQYVKRDIDFDDFKILDTANRQARKLVSIIDEKASVSKKAKIKTKKFGRIFSSMEIDNLIAFLNDIERNIDDLLISKPLQLLAIHNNIYPSGTTIENWAKNICSMIFDYDLFYKSENNNWGFGAEYARRLDVNVCPYCNRNYITTVLDVNGVKHIGPTFDHFLPQFKYPMFLISMYNLIPSCTICNSNLKHEKPFDLTNFIYPYEDEMGDDAIFDYIYTANNPSNRLDPTNFHLYIRPDKAISAMEQKLRGPGCDPLKGSLNVFKTIEIYRKAHLDTVAELDLKCDKESKMHALSVLNLMGGYFGYKEFYRYYFANYLDKKDWNKRPLAKLTYDIVSNRIKKFK